MIFQYNKGVGGAAETNLGMGVAAGAGGAGVGGAKVSWGSPGKPSGFCHGCGKGNFKMLKRGTWYVLLSSVRKLHRIYI